MRGQRFWILAAFLISSLCASTGRVQHPSSRLALQPCTLAHVTGEASCGTFKVFEDRVARAGRTIRLYIVVLKALEPDAANDPVFWLHGGPGAAATDMVAAAQNGIFAAARRKHDLVFVDQRGTGSSNPLRCDLDGSPSDLQAYFAEMFPRDKIRECRAKLDKIANLKLYTTPIAMDDLDEVRAALGYRQINLLGASYGTIAAQVYIRRHPEHVRSAFLVGVATPDIKQPLLFPRSAQHAMDLLFTDCDADELCHKNFPSAKQEFDAVLARFAGGPLEVELINPHTEKRERVRLPRSSFVEHLRLVMYTTGGQRLVPFIIHRAFLKDYVPWEKAAIYASPGAGVARGMYFTITCSEGVPFITDQDLVNETRGTYVGEDRVRLHMEACKEWPRADIPRNYIEPVKSDVPVLMISGEVDGSSPPWYGENAVKFLSRGRLVKVRYFGHQMEGPCIQQIFEHFLAAASAEGLDTSCTSAIRRPPFATEMPPQFALK
ncbi:MAG TPA: alpha/beta hydrolase [Candidatus Angelobacter sp.]|jgi:pimeloyl-ACP methyl ester carboxylesterase